MLGNSTLPARGLVAAGLTGLITLTAAPAFGSAIPAARHAAAHTVTTPAATAAGRSKDPTARFHHWRRAQRAAGFRLKVPSRTFGLTRKNPILVGPCDAAGQHRKRDVFAQWGARRQFLALDQNNSGRACSNFGAAKPLGVFRVQGHKARLFGFCGMTGLPSCRSKNVVLLLAWREHHRYYVAISSRESRATLLAFGRHLRFR